MSTNKFTTMFKFQKGKFVLNIYPHKNGVNVEDDVSRNSPGSSFCFPPLNLLRYSFTLRPKVQTVSWIGLRSISDACSEGSIDKVSPHGNLHSSL